MEYDKVKISARGREISWPCHLGQWRSQDEQVTWAHHGHTQCVCNTYLLGDLGHAPTMKKFKLYTLRSLLRPFQAQIQLFRLTAVCSLLVRIKIVIAHVNN